MSCGDDNIYQTYPINLFRRVVPASLVGCVAGIAWLGAVAVTVRYRSPEEAISFNIDTVCIKL
jgi:hypothetical protein